jgi:hypothetical protein
MKFHYETAKHTLQLEGQQQKLNELRAEKYQRIAINAQEAFADIENYQGSEGFSHFPVGGLTGCSIKRFWSCRIIAPLLIT